VAKFNKNELLTKIVDNAEKDRKIAMGAIQLIQEQLFTSDDEEESQNKRLDYGAGKILSNLIDNLTKSNEQLIKSASLVKDREGEGDFETSEEFEEFIFENLQNNR